VMRAAMIFAVLLSSGAAPFPASPKSAHLQLR
jgi:hypothetical protein